MYWGFSFDPIPKELGEILVWAARKRFDIGESTAKDKVYNGLYEARTAKRSELRVSFVNGHTTNY